MPAMWEVGGTGWRNSRAFRLRLVWVASFRQGANARFCRRTSLSRWDQEYWLEVEGFPRGQAFEDVSTGACFKGLKDKVYLFVNGHHDHL